MDFHFVIGISMHKGYAFVQFTNPFDARSACLGEDGRTVLSQILGKSLLKKSYSYKNGFLKSYTTIFHSVYKFFFCKMIY